MTRYDLEDSTLFFDYQVLRAQLALGYEREPSWNASLGPRAEVLQSRLDPAEGYREAGGALDVEFLGSGSWWSVTPAAGWREYDRTATDGLGGQPLHSSYAFYAFELIADQALPAGLRLRAITSLRWEYHLDPAQDARSVYGSLELIRALR